VALHIFLLPLLGVALAVLNYRRLRDWRGASKATALFGVPAFGFAAYGIAAFASGWRNVPMAFLSCGLRLALTYFAFRDQRRLVQPYFTAGALKARSALGWLLAAAAFVLMLAVWQVLQPHSHR
jgi:predicted permease